MSSPHPATTLSSHVLDLVAGGPAEGVLLVLEHWRDGAWVETWRGHTDDDGRCRGLLAADDPQQGRFRLTFHAGAWQQARGRASFYPEVPVVFEVAAAGQHYHVPLLMGPYGYSTYRGS